MDNVINFRDKSMDNRSLENKDMVDKALALARSLQNLDELVCHISAGEITSRQAWILKDGSDISRELPQLAHVILDKEYMINNNKTAGDDFMCCVEVIFTRLARAIEQGNISKPVLNLLKGHIERLNFVIKNSDLERYGCNG